MPRRFQAKQAGEQREYSCGHGRPGHLTRQRQAPFDVSLCANIEAMLAPGL
ncbi:hypothetical protein [Serratia quinivorans]|uniref:hypothetical protein n=1 Tax=Serratia quinivorans TaxID=137545 RepID=UPI003F99DB81